MFKNLNHYSRQNQEKKKILDDPLYNILELFKILILVPFTKSKTELDISHKKLYIRVAQRVAEWGINMW